MTAVSAIRFDRAAWARAADYLAVAVAITLPWSSSGTSITVGLWLVALVPSLDWQALRREIMTPAGGLPVALVVLGGLGMLWADVTFVDRWRGVESFLKLLVIPLLFAQFRTSERGLWPLGAYLASATALLAVSFFIAAVPSMVWSTTKSLGVPVKDYIAQSAEFTLAAFGALYLALQRAKEGRWPLAAAFALLGVLFLSNIFYVATSRTALVTLPALLALIVVTRCTGKIRAAMVVAGIGAVIAVWFLSPLMRERLSSLPTEIQQFRSAGTRTSAGDRIDFWSKGLAIVRDAPLIGHGTGSIREMYQRAAIDKTGTTFEVTDNPHNQTFAVAIQLGLAGAILLWAMWIAHFAVFVRAHGVAGFAGLAVVAQNIVGSLFNTHLFDFTHGWIYAFGVGIAGGAVLAQSRGSPISASKKRRGGR